MTSTFKRYDQMDADFFRRIILGQDVDTNEDPVQADTTRPTGLMTPDAGARVPSQRVASNTESTSDNILTRAASALGAFSTDRQQVADAIVPRQEDPPQIDLSEWESLPPLEDVLDLRRSAAIDAQLQAMNRDAVGIRESLRPATPAATQEPADEQATEETPTEETPEETSSFSSVTNNLYDAFTVGGQEGTEAHVGLDSQNITLPAGIVADGLVYNGQTINAGQNTIPASSFNLSLLDTSGAYKTIGTGDNAVTIRRSDYNSDQDFSRAVIAEFENRARTAAGDNWSNIPQAAQEALVKVGWNLGEDWYSGSSARTLYNELSSATPNINRINSSILRASTVLGGGASIGIAKARADAYNAAREVFNGAEITRVDADNTGTNTAFKYYDAAGNLVHTEQTSRAVGLYENGDNTRVEKNAAGEW